MTELPELLGAGATFHNVGQERVGHPVPNFNTNHSREVFVNFKELAITVEWAHRYTAVLHESQPYVVGHAVGVIRSILRVVHDDGTEIAAATVYDWTSHGRERAAPTRDYPHVNPEAEMVGTIGPIAAADGSRLTLQVELENGVWVWVCVCRCVCVFVCLCVSESERQRERAPLKKKKQKRPKKQMKNKKKEEDEENRKRRPRP